MNRRRTVNALVAAPLSLGLAGAAWGFWTSPVASGSAGAAAATTVGSTAAPTATASPTTVSLQWEAATLGDGSPVTGYRVQRLDAGDTTGGARTGEATGECAGVVTALTCTETVPDGRWSYTVTPVVGTSWRGAASPASRPVTTGTGPVGGSVVPTGLVGTGARYTSSTTVTLALDPGADPDGTATAGSALRRSWARLSSTGGPDGTCGDFGAFEPVATEPVSPYVDTVPAAGRCYRYEYVAADVYGNTTTVTSTVDVKVDVTAPAAPALALTESSPAAHAAGTVLFHRPGTSGSMTVRPTGKDLESGVQGYTWSDLPGWAVSRGTTSATYAWGTSTTSPATATVTARNNAGLTSAPAALSTVVDTTAPSASITYDDGTTTADRVRVTLGGATDSQSGVALHRIERAEARATADGCEPFTAFAPVAYYGLSPQTRWYPVQPGSCYRYRYVAVDNVGNETVATSPSVVRAVTGTYAATVQATAGLQGFWRLGEHTVARDVFEGAAGSPAGATRPGQLGTLGSFGVPAVLTADGRLRRAGATSLTSAATLGGIHISTEQADTPDYAVEAVLHVESLLPNDSAAVWGRAQDATSGYAARYDVATASWQLVKVVSFPTLTVLARTPETLVPGRDYRLTLDLKGDAIRLLVDGDERLAVTDSAYAHPGTGGIALGYGPGASQAPTDRSGLHVDEFTVTPHAADQVGGAEGVHLGVPALDQAPATSQDANTSASFDGLDDRTRIPTAVTDALSVELLFRSSTGAGAGSSWQDAARLLEADLAGSSDLGVSLAADGRVVAGLGESTVSSPAGYADGAWHHLVLTRDATTGTLVLLLDGARVGSVDGPTAVVAGAATVALGRGATGPAYAGSLDEVALYAATLDAGTVAHHHASR